MKERLIVSFMFVCLVGMTLVALLPYYEYWVAHHHDWRNDPISEFQSNGKVFKVTRSKAAIDSYYTLNARSTQAQVMKSLDIPTQMISDSQLTQLLGQTFNVRYSSAYSVGTWPIEIFVDQKPLIDAEALRQYYLKQKRSTLYWIWIMVLLFGGLSYTTGMVLYGLFRRPKTS
jgi:hypothetical protein